MLESQSESHFSKTADVGWDSSPNTKEQEGTDCRCRYRGENRISQKQPMLDRRTIQTPKSKRELIGP
ncbi:hypothetical protein ACOMHN_062909 [Nucella lapillus]